MSGEFAGYDPEAFRQIAELEPGSWWFRSRNRLIEGTVRRYFGKAESVLEIGCGTGFTLGALRRALPQARLTATELFEEGLEVARSRWPEIALTQADARALPFNSEFDLVAAFDVLEHIDDDAGALAEARRVLTPAGGLIVTVPQHQWLWSAADDYAQHQRRYSRRQLIGRIEAAGFDVRMVTSFVSALLPAMTISRSISGLRRHRAKADFDPWSEFRIPPMLDLAFERLAGGERWMINHGVSLPAGGSLLLAAIRR